MKIRTCSHWASLLALIGFVSQNAPAASKADWQQLNIGPFSAYFQQDAVAARDALTQAEQVRWVLEGLLENKDLVPLWPIKVIYTTDRPPSAPEFVPQNGQYLFLLSPGKPVPLAKIAELLVRDNTPRLPDEVESGLIDLLSTVHAKGSRVTWGGPPSQPADLGFARFQLLASRPEYAGRLHIFVTNIRDGGSLTTAERNAFGEDPKEIETKVKANLAAKHFEPVSVSGRPLDPRRDLGEHSVSSAVVNAYISDTQLSANPKTAEGAYKAAIEEGGAATALGHAGLAAVAKVEKENPVPYLESAVRAGSLDPGVYVELADGMSPDEALPLLKKAQKLNPRWAEPVFRQSTLTSDKAEQESLLKQATVLSPRTTRYWIELAQTQVKNGHIAAAQGTWLRAENSAPTTVERDRIHQQRLDYEEHRLDALEAERRRTEAAVDAEEHRVQSAEARRIKDAERRANGSLDAEAGGARPQNPVAWSDEASKTLSGTITKVDCLKGTNRVWIKPLNGSLLALQIPDISAAKLSCGSQSQSVPVIVQYAPRIDRHSGTVGDVVSLNPR